IFFLTNYAFSQDLAVMKDAFTKSYTYEKSKEYSKAITEILAIYDATSYETNIRLGWLYYMNASYTTSAQYYAKAAAIMPYSVEALLGYVLPEKALGNSDLVSATYLAVLKIDPQNSYANYNLGLIYYNKKDYKTAYTYLEKVGNMYPFDYDIAILFAWTNFQLGKLREAKVLFTKALLITPGDASATEGLSLIK
ncbi:MAG: tetratricopeptide repeat protein, partial [Bacteroidetes bacterium]|nr:tetratricopeptide repeat protein [Bacteroidota bacterium]